MIEEIQYETDLQQEKLNFADSFLSRNYLSLLNSPNHFPIINEKTVPVLNESANFDTYLNKNIRFFEISQIVLNKNENMRDKLVSVFNAIGTVGASIVLLIHGNEDTVKITFGVKSNDTNNLPNYKKIFENCLKGNFPGIKIRNYVKDDLHKIYEGALEPNFSVATVTDVPSYRTEIENKDRRFMQGIEKLIDTMHGQTYTLLLIADPLTNEDIRKSRLALENLYSTLVPLSEMQYNYGISENQSVSQAITKGLTKTITQSISDSISHTVGKSTSTTIGESSTAQAGFSPFGIGISGSKTFTNSQTFSQNESNTEGTTKLKGESESTLENTTNSSQIGRSKTASHQIKYENFTIKRMMEKIGHTLKRYDECADVGMWNTAVYCLAPDSHIAQMLASSYHSLIRGKNSGIEHGSVVLFDNEQSKAIMNSFLRYMNHPCFKIEENYLTPGTLISSSELSIMAGLPNSSVPGIPVIDCAEFGRTVSSYDLTDLKEKKYKLDLGVIYHMHKDEGQQVVLNPNSLTMHTFVTGTTGSGKSNAVYNMLTQLPNLGCHFLVIEPAKGEYKNVFSNIAHIYGVIPNKSDLLKINPFSFPKEIHILEHLDRLIDIFNVCWPMYAAMPAVLKEAIEKSYEDVGWDLSLSTNEYGRLFPSFSDVTRNIKTVIDQSEYDAENKGAYKGSLLTRLSSLSNGINGLIFSNDEIDNSELFDNNTIIDLSHVGASETKSLIMGLLVLKLQEYRMTSGQINSALKHVTVLEEAHNLLKRTNSVQSIDTANIAGKSVEMLTNSIAEMRTYGEGFIIADQAPNLLDPAVIRNTNTKIILRLPDFNDRQVVGKASNLNEEQINELAKLPRGVAAVYQNEWVECVLCHIDEAHIIKKFFEYDKKIILESKDNTETIIKLCNTLCNDNHEKIIANEDLIGLTAYQRVSILKYIGEFKKGNDWLKLSSVVANLLPNIAKKFKFEFEKTKDIAKAKFILESSLKELNIPLETSIGIEQCILTNYTYNVVHNPEIFENIIKG
ncbi:ATP-binding protein [Succinivibrio dextrinosolvens]|uniref:ATP-binding protein n=1 Tax=Succinivibrio dextrinosolvens TaxID=83771 RepID=UPI00241D5366|nr:DUF87 domain-containing protein [Succinivibrio dextrinosolvens]MBE6424209.1 ATP-binding protein [Succinivibrio dextrinosolvens]